VRNGDTLAPALTDSARWKHLIVDYPNFATVKTMTDFRYNYVFEPDTITKLITIYMPSDTVNKYKFTYQQRDSTLFLNGKLLADTLSIQLRRKDVRQFLLVNRGFNWINEFPYNK